MRVPLFAGKVSAIEGAGNFQPRVAAPDAYVADCVIAAAVSYLYVVLAGGCAGLFDCLCLSAVCEWVYCAFEFFETVGDCVKNANQD
jgi:hypothetical protein